MAQSQPACQGLGPPSQFAVCLASRAVCSVQLVYCHPRNSRRFQIIVLSRLALWLARLGGGPARPGQACWTGRFLESTPRHATPRRAAPVGWLSQAQPQYLVPKRYEAGPSARHGLWAQWGWERVSAGVVLSDWTASPGPRPSSAQPRSAPPSPARPRGVRLNLESFNIS